MTTLILGGARSGKSAYAESLLAALPPPRWYVATMQPWDEECRVRIAKHRRARAGKGFETLECSRALAALRLPRRGSALLECLGNLAANELYSAGSVREEEAILTALLAGVAALEEQCEHLVIVSNEVCLGGEEYAGDTDAYLRVLAAAHRALGQRAGRVCEVCAGRAVYYKGKGPEQ